jgi:adenylate kinase family enzyme
MKRIIVIGSSGAGKSHFSQRLGELLGIDVLHIDKIYWQPGWIEPDKAEWAERLKTFLAGESWIIDGNYSGTIEMRLAACDTAIFLDLPRLLCVWRVIWRTITFHRDTRPDMAVGCDERFDLKFLLWIWQYPKRSRPKIDRLLHEVEGSKNVVRLRSRKEIEEFLESAAELSQNR